MPLFLQTEREDTFISISSRPRFLICCPYCLADATIASSYFKDVSSPNNKKPALTSTASGPYAIIPLPGQPRRLGQCLGLGHSREVFLL